MSLEQELIRGAYWAHAKDPQNLVGQAKRRAGEKFTQSVKDIVGLATAKKKAEQKQNEANDKTIDDNIKEQVDNQGLGPKMWGDARDLTDEIKIDHDACPPGPEGNRCRTKANMRVKSLGGKYKDLKETFDDFVIGTRDKIKSKKLDASKYKESYNKAMLAGCKDANGSHRMKNDEAIAEAQEQLKTAKPEEKEAIKKNIESLKESNDIEVGYAFNYTDDKGVEQDMFITESDLGSFQPHVATDLTTTYGTRVEDQNLKYKKFKKGEEGGEGFDMDESKHAHKKQISPENITSIYYDNVLGTTQPLKEHLLIHPAFNKDNGMSYEDLGLSEERIASLDKDEDGRIDKKELEGLKDEDKERIITALSDPEDDFYNFETSKDIAAEWMALNEEKEANKTLYGPEYYPEPSGENGVWMPADLTIPDYKGEGDMWFSTPEEYQAALKYDKSTQRDGEDDQHFFDRGGIKGAGAGRSKVYKEIYGKSVEKQELIEGETTEDIIAKL